MTLREWLLFFHILAAMVWLGGSVLLLLQGYRVRRASGDDRIRFLRTVDFAGKFVFNISGIAVFVFGLWMVLDNTDLYGFDAWWIGLAMTVVIASAILGMAFYGPQTGKALGIAAERGGDDAAVVGITNRIALIASIELVFLVFVLWTMVFKPGS